MTMLTPIVKAKLPPSGEPPRWQELLINDFSGGLATDYDQTRLNDNQFTTLTNYYLKNDKSIEARGGSKPLDVSAGKESIIPNSAAPLSFTIVDIANTEFTIATWDAGSFYETSYWDQSNDRWAGEGGGTAIKADWTEGYDVKYLRYTINDQEDLILFNGKDMPQRWLGTAVASTDLGLTAPSDPHSVITDVEIGASPIEITLATASDLAVGDYVIFRDIVGTAGVDVLNDNPFAVSAVTDSTHFDVAASTAGKTYTSGGYIDEIFIPVPSAAAAYDNGIQYNGVYTYTATYFYDGSSTKYGESGTGIHHTATISDIAGVTERAEVTIEPFAFPTGVGEVYVYRSPPDESSGPFRYVGKITTEHTAWVDSTPVGEEGVEAPIDAGTPPRLKNAITFVGRIWGIGLNSSGALKNKGVYSNAGSPDFYPATNFFYLPDPIIGPKEFNQNVYWFTEKAIYVVPNGDIATYPEPLKISETGCDSYDSITDVGNGLCWQFQGNIYWANFNTYNDQVGDFPFPIGDPIANQINGIATSYESNSVGVLYQDRYYISFTETDQTVNTKTLVWDVKIGTSLLKQGLYGAWSEVDFKANWLVNYQNTLWTADNTNRYLIEHDVDTVDYRSKTDFDASTSYNINTYIDTGLLHLGHEWDYKLAHSLSLWADTTGCTYTAKVNLNDGDFIKTKSFVLAAGEGATTGFLLDTDVLDTGVLGTATGAEYRSDHVKIGSGAKGRNMKVFISSANTGTTNLLGFKLYWKRFKDTA